MTGTEHTIPITFDLGLVGSYTDEFLATLWHVAQANPAPHGDYQAGEIVAHLGWEIIRRWLSGIGPSLYHHQQRDTYAKALRSLATYQPPEGVRPADRAWHDGQWVPKLAAAGGDVAS